MNKYLQFCRIGAATALILAGIAGQFLAATSHSQEVRSQGVTPNFEFAAVSIKPSSRLTSGPSGYYGCHGTDNSGRMFRPNGRTHTGRAGGAVFR